MVLLEAASVAVPVVASNIGENRSVLQDNALYFESGSVDALANRLEWVLANEAASRELGKRGQEHVRKTYDWDAIAQQYASAYRRLSEKGAPFYESAIC